MNEVKNEVKHSGRGMTSMRSRERMIQRLISEGIKDEATLEAVAQVPRHLFVEEALANRAYEDTALPIGSGQTISAPLTVAQMTQALVGGLSLEERAGLKVLEVGTGSGYQAAVLSACVGRVYTVERIRSLKIKAAQRIRQLGIHNCIVKHGDGGLGLPSYAPFDCILVAAAGPQVPLELIDQLKVGGHLIMPIGVEQQFLHHIEKTPTGMENKRLMPAHFVPFLEGWVNT